MDDLPEADFLEGRWPSGTILRVADDQRVAEAEAKEYAAAHN